MGWVCLGCPVQVDKELLPWPAQGKTFPLKWLIEYYLLWLLYFMLNICNLCVNVHYVDCCNKHWNWNWWEQYTPLHFSLMPWLPSLGMHGEKKRNTPKVSILGPPKWVKSNAWTKKCGNNLVCRTVPQIGGVMIDSRIWVNHYPNLLGKEIGKYVSQRNHILQIAKYSNFLILFKF